MIEGCALNKKYNPDQYPSQKHIRHAQNQLEVIKIPTPITSDLHAR
jgi:hypothetical protein